MPVWSQISKAQCKSGNSQFTHYHPFAHGYAPLERFKACHTQHLVFTPACLNCKAHSRHIGVPNSPNAGAQKKGNEMAAIGAKGIYSLDVSFGSCRCSKSCLYCLQNSTTSSFAIRHPLISFSSARACVAPMSVMHVHLVCLYVLLSSVYLQLAL